MSEPGEIFMTGSRFFSWDNGDQPEWADINDAVQDLWVAGDPPPLIFSVPDTGCDQCGLIVTNWAMTSTQKCTAWLYWLTHEAYR